VNEDKVIGRTEVIFEIESPYITGDTASVAKLFAKIPGAKQIQQPNGTNVQVYTSALLDAAT
jgi:hypothetical protein